jgi:hypothetical protein
MSRTNLPEWPKSNHLFDGLEISPCVIVGNGRWGAYIEVCDDPADAEFWSVYGHYNPALCHGFGGVDCLEDFATEAQARAFAEELYSRHPHLRNRGPA